MQITLKVKYRLKNHEVTGPRSSTSGMCGSVRLSGPAPQFRSEPAPASSVDEEREIVSGDNALNHFSEPNNKLSEPDRDSSRTSVQPAAGAVEKAIQLDQILVEEVQLLPSSRIVMHTDPRSAGADRFRFLRMCLRELWNAGKLKTLQITSPLPQEGKSTVALNLATALAEGGRRTVLLIEADLHRPTLTQQMGLEEREGLADCLEGRLNPVAALRRLEPLGFYLLPAGKPRSNPTELLQTEAFAGVLQRVSPHFDWVLIDSPPVIPLTDALSIARQANATLMVAREGRTPHEAIEKAIAVVGRQRVLGIVLNAVEGLDRMYSGYYGYGGYSTGNGVKEVGCGETLKGSTARPALPAKRSFFNPPE